MPAQVLFVRERRTRIYRIIIQRVCFSALKGIQTRKKFALGDYVRELGRGGGGCAARHGKCSFEVQALTCTPVNRLRSGTWNKNSKYAHEGTLFQTFPWTHIKSYMFTNTRLLLLMQLLFDHLCGLVIRVPCYITEMYCASCEVRTEFIYVM
jgi:hypothetical protein